MTQAQQPRVMVYVQHLLGIGHLMRARRIAQALDKAEFQVTLVSGGVPVPGFDSYTIDQVALESIAVRDGSFGELLDGEGNTIDDAFKARRSQHLLDVFERFRPDLVMLEAFPFGRRQLRFELLPLIDAIKVSVPKPVLVTSLRDVLQRNRKPGRDEETASLVMRYFDKVLVHGDPSIATLDETFPFVREIADKIVYTGLVCGSAPEVSTHTFDIVVSAGGGAVGLSLVRASLQAAWRLPEIKSWCVITGPNLPQNEYDALASKVPANVLLVRFRPDFVSLLANTSLSISQAGYNTVSDILQARCRALLIPFSKQGETEQADRAMSLNKLGLASVLSDDYLSDTLTSGEKLAAAIRLALLQQPAPAASTINVGGAVGTVNVLRDMLRDRHGQKTENDIAATRAMPKVGHDTGADNAWVQLDAELAAWSSDGRTATFWWRDDDASAPGPKLDKLMDISAPCGLLLAVIPTRLDSSLSTALTHTPHVHIAQHGYAHINHAPRGLGLGAWELGLHRGLDKVMADLDAGHTILQAQFESTLLPVIVPPWNRIAPELLKPIATNGFYGVSAFGPRDHKHPEQGLTIVNTHCDPIRWKSGPQFRGVTKTIAQLLEHLRARRVGNVDADEPTGLLTHHIDLDAAGWDFCTQLASVIDQHDAAQWCSPEHLFCAQAHE